MAALADAAPCQAVGETIDATTQLAVAQSFTGLEKIECGGVGHLGGCVIEQGGHVSR